MNAMEKLDNDKKGELFRKAMLRAKRAHKSGFYLESISLCDSIIRGRVESILRHSAGEHRKTRGSNDAIRLIQELNIPIFDTSLVEISRIWGRSRNSAIHSFSELQEFDQLSWRSRISIVRVASAEGLELIIRWSKEARKHRI